jgi:hypothetical protein
MRGKTIVGTIVILLASLALAWYVWMVYGTKSPFNPPLFHFDHHSVNAISIGLGNEELIYSLSHQGWNISNGMRGGRFVPETEVHSALQAVLALTPKRMATSKEKTYPGKSTSATIRLRFNNRKEEVFTLFLPAGQEEIALLQFQGEEEVFFVPAPHVAFFFRPFSDFNERTLIRPPLPDLVDSLTYVLPRDSVKYLFCRDSSKWYLKQPDSLSLDTLAFFQWWAKLNDLSAPIPSDDFDEIQEATTIGRRLIFWSKGRSLLEIEGFIRPWKKYSYVLHASQRPGDYFEGDSTGLFLQIFAPLDSVIQISLKQ